MTAARTTIAKRLHTEMERKAIRAEEVAALSGIPLKVIKDYLSAQRALRFDELRPLCQTLHVSLMRLVAPVFTESLLHYRAARSEDRARAAEIENAFLLLWDAVPNAKPIPVAAPSEQHRDIGMLLAEINAAVETLRERYPSIEKLVEATRLPLLPVHAGDSSFDAFLMTAGGKSIACVNLDKPTVRLHFSLLHEVAHYLFHRDRPVPIDVLHLDAYADTISADTIAEYVANKFAQLYLVPMAEAQRAARHWEQWAEIRQYVTERRTGPEVLANSIFDVLRLTAKGTRYTQVRDSLKQQVGAYRTDDTVRTFVMQRGNELRHRVACLRDDFADEVWALIAQAWELPGD